MWKTNSKLKLCSRRFYKQSRNKEGIHRKQTRLYVITIHFFKKSSNTTISTNQFVSNGSPTRTHTHPHTTCFNCVTKWETLKNGAILSKSWIRTICLINLREKKRTRVKQTSYSCRKKRLFRLSPAPTLFKESFLFSLLFNLSLFYENYDKLVTNPILLVIIILFYLVQTKTSR